MVRRRIEPEKPRTRGGFCVVPTAKISVHFSLFLWEIFGLRRFEPFFLPLFLYFTYSAVARNPVSEAKSVWQASEKIAVGKPVKLEGTKCRISESPIKLPGP